MVNDRTYTQPRFCLSQEPGLQSSILYTLTPIGISHRLWRLVSNSAYNHHLAKLRLLCPSVLSNPAPEPSAAPRLCSLMNVHGFPLLDSPVFWSSLYVQPLDLSPFPFVGITEIWHLICPLLLSLSGLLKSIYGYMSLDKSTLPVPLTTVFLSLPSPIRRWTIL